MCDDYVVALDKSLGTLVKIWRGTSFRPFDEDRVWQIKLLEENEGEAIRKAKSIHRSFYLDRKEKSR